MSAASQPALYHICNLETGWEKIDAQVVAEAAVSLTVNGDDWLSFTCTPADLEALAVGFLFNEGVIQDLSQIASIYKCPNGDNIDIWLNFSVEKPKHWQRTSGCAGGVTDTMKDDLVGSTAGKYGNHAASINLYSPQVVLETMEHLLRSQEEYHSTGGIHSSALSDGKKIWILAEDIGRHNTLDKIAGRVLLENVTIEAGILATTGRISSEMMQKSARLGAALVLSRTSPTSQAVDLASKLGITLIGYARRNQFRVYTHPEHISGYGGFVTI